MLFLQNKEGSKRAALSDIRYIKGHGDFLLVFTTLRSEPYRIACTFTPVEELLSDRFHRVNRSWIVNLDHVDFIVGRKITMDDGTEIPIGGTYYKKFTDFVNTSAIGSLTK